MKNHPRRARSQWREAAPDYFLDCFDHPKRNDRYTILFGGELRGRNDNGATWINYLACSANPTSPVGFSQWGEFTDSDARNYRYASSRQRIRWLDLPEHVRAHIVARATSE